MDNKGKSIKECKDFYGEIIRLGDAVIIAEPTKCEKGFSGKVIGIVKKGDICFIRVYNTETHVTLEDVESTKYTTQERFDIKQKYDFLKPIREWVAEDEKHGNHVYTQYTDIDGIKLAERMILQNAWSGQEPRLYYVAKDKETNEYYLQSFRDYKLISFYRYMPNHCGKEIASIRKKIEEASTLFQVRTEAEGDRVSFLEDFGFKDGKIPYIAKIVDGKIIREEI